MSYVYICMYICTYVCTHNDDAAALGAGGGRRNNTMMCDLSSCLSMPLVAQNTEGFDADMLEAELMAFLAARFHFGLPTSFPHTTGCHRPISGGQLALAR